MKPLTLLLLLITSCAVVSGGSWYRSKIKYTKGYGKPTKPGERKDSRMVQENDLDVNLRDLLHQYLSDEEVRNSKEDLFGEIDVGDFDLDNLQKRSWFRYNLRTYRKPTPKRSWFRNNMMRYKKPKPKRSWFRNNMKQYRKPTPKRSRFRNNMKKYRKPKPKRSWFRQSMKSYRKRKRLGRDEEKRGSDKEGQRAFASFNE